MTLKVRDLPYCLLSLGTQRPHVLRMGGHPSLKMAMQPLLHGLHLAQSTVPCKPIWGWGNRNLISSPSSIFWYPVFKSPLHFSLILTVWVFVPMALKQSWGVKRTVESHMPESDISLSLSSPCHYLLSKACACVLSCFSCVQLCDPMDCGPSGSSVHGILQARILEWVAMPSSRESSWPRDQTHISYVSCIGRRVLYH